MDDTTKQSDRQDGVMGLDDIENLIRQVDVMVGVGEISPFPEEEVVVEQEAVVSEAEQAAQSMLDELDEFESLTPSVQFFKQIQLTIPGKVGRALSLPVLRKCSEKNAQVMCEAVDDPALLVDYLGIPVFPGQVFARVVTLDKEGNVVTGEQLHAEENSRAQVIVEWDGEQIEAGPYVELADGEFKAERYGYLTVAADRFSVVSPFFVSADRLQLRWGIFARSAQSVTPAMLQPWFDEIGVQPDLLDVDKVERLIRALGQGEHKRGAFLVACGEKPVAGIDARVELLVPMERSSGIERPDGSVDFREVNYLPNVEEGQLIAHRIPPAPGTPGTDVTGEEIPAEGGRDVKLRIDKTVRRVHEADVELYYAAQSGAVRFEGKALSVVNVYSLGGGVNYESGNIDFVGDVFVHGGVAEGFSIRASGDITVAETVSDGVEIFSETGSVTIGRGVIGRRTRISAKQTVRAQFVHDATIQAGEDIVVGNYIYNAALFAGGNIEVHKGEGARGGSLLGGRAVALVSMTMWTAGSPSWVATELAVGFDPDATEKRERVKEAVTKTSRHLHRILDVFGLSRLEPDRIRDKVAKATGTQRKFLEQQARLLGQLAKSYKALLDMRQSLSETPPSDEKGPRPKIKVQGTAHPGVTVRIGRQTLKLDREYGAVIFKQGEKGIEAV